MLKCSRLFCSPLVSPYGAALHGPLRLPTVRLPPPEPFDLWLACRNAVAPFRECAIVAGDMGFCERATKHFVKVFRRAASPLSPADSEIALLPVGDTLTDQQQQQQRDSMIRRPDFAADICIVQVDPLHQHERSFDRIFATLAPYLRPHGALCLTGAVLPGALKNDVLRQDWQDVVSWLFEPEESEDIYRHPRYHHFLTTDGYNEVKAAAAAAFSAKSAAAVNMALHTFDAEHEVTLPQLSALLRSMPAYRRREKFTVDPVECFEELARAKLFTASPASSSSNPSVRLAIRHWLWICDRRPRSRDSVSLPRR
jgi:hypothetical protein